MGTLLDQITALRVSIATAQTQIDTLTGQLCQIGGTLFNDTNADGTRGGGETVTGVRRVILQPGGITVASDAAGCYTIANLDPGSYALTRPDFPPGYHLSNPSVAVGSVIAVTLAPGEHRTVDIGTTNRPAGPIAVTEVGALTSDDVKPATPPAMPPSVPDMPPSTQPATPSKWAAIGACITLHLDAKDDPAAAATVAKARMLGLTHLRAFGPSCRLGGTVDGGYANQVRRLTSRGMRVIVMHGAPEADPAHTAYADDDWKRYFDAVAVARNGNAAYEVELQNECNLSRYWPLGGGAKLSAPAVAKMMAVAKIARTCLGPAATIIGPSIGYDADTTPHLQYQRALLDAGLLDYASAINTHLYFARPQQLCDVLGPYREWVGLAAKIYSTEANCPVALARYAAAAPAFVAAIRAAGVIPMVYRLTPRGDNPLDDRCLFGDRNQPNTLVTTAWIT